ncbi:elongator complex protein 3 [Anaerotruncus rubiinfantis]|uniref:elongator complex protein 3 n=1 Tax=Anaerotruncus rubiinfantis TaxID=1720200 RepID=UPI00082F6124|nr:radical SAM protein [Anaerotruncus rubiinfantis]
MKHANLSIFVPHAGCPHRCSFCNQKSISGAADCPSGGDVIALCEAQAARMQNREGEIAFFGGSFTAIDREYRTELLEAAAPFVHNGMFRGIRISTRPDCIDPETLAVLKSYGVTAIELGAQSMDDKVLRENGRGHTAWDVEHAARLILEGGFALGLQMMTGLWGADDESDLTTAQRLAALGPQTVRVYPTLVMEGTRLARLYRNGYYRPQTFEGAVVLGARLLEYFTERGIRVIRMGLHAEGTLEAGLLAGPYHPAFRELCEGRLLQNRIRGLLEGKAPGNFILRTAPRNVSKIMGHGACGIVQLRELGYNIRLRQDAAMTGLTLEIEDV